MIGLRLSRVLFVLVIGWVRLGLIIIRRLRLVLRSLVVRTLILVIRLLIVLSMMGGRFVSRLGLVPRVVNGV